MEIQFDYWLGEKGRERLMHVTVTEEEIKEMLEKKFREGEIACPIHYDRETVKVEFCVDKVIV
jgi:hypothetical protein